MKEEGAGLEFWGAQTLYLQMLQDKAFLFTSIQKKKNQIHCFCSCLTYCGFFLPTSHINRLSLEAQVQCSHLYKE